MAAIHRLTRSGVFAFMVALAIVVGFLPRAEATHPSGTMLVQQWEVLAGARYGMSSGTTIQLERGQQSWDATFDPAPSVTFEVVGRVAGATGSATWTVQLGNLGSVTFNAADSGLGYLVKSTAMTWPATPPPLSSLTISANAPAPSLQGVFDITKAYLRFSQQGAIRTTVGRMPLAAAQTVSAPAGWMDASDPILYQHSLAGYEPAPSIRLRIGVDPPPWPGSGAVRLVNQTGTPVPGSTLSFIDDPQQAMYTAPLSLTQGSTYRLQVDGSAFPTWKLLSADLEFLQTTSDPHGIVSTVSWYPSVTCGTDLAGSSNLNFLFSRPEHNAEFVSGSWLTTIKRTSSVGTVRADLVNQSGSLVASGAATSSADFVSFSSPVTNLSQSGQKWDTKPLLSGSGQGRLAGSVLRLTLRLRDTITSLTTSLSTISPNGDGRKDETTIAASIDSSVPSPNWTLSITAGSGSVVRTFTGTGHTVSVVWEGDSASGDLVPDGIYGATLTLAGLPNVQRSISITIDNTRPVVAFIAPKANGNALYMGQPIVAELTDRRAELNDLGADAPRVSQYRTDEDGSGIDAQTISVVVRRVGGGQADQNLTSSLSGSILRSSEATLVAGGTYDATITVRDNAGTETRSTARFLATTVATASPPNVTIPEQVPTSVEPGGPGDPNDRYVWDEPDAAAAPISIAVQNTLHKGDGWVAVNYSPATASVSYTVNGVPGAPLHPAETQAVLRVPFTVTQTGSVSLQTPTHTGATSRLTALVPKGADPGSVKLTMGATPSISAVFPTCKDPTVAVDCGPDPIASTGRQEERWGPWANLLDVDPYDLPGSVGQLEELSLASNSCAGTPPSLSQAVTNLGNALGISDSLVSGLNLSSELSEGLARIVQCFASHVPLLPHVPGLPSVTQRARWLAAERDILSTVELFPTSAAFPGPDCTVVNQAGNIEVCGSAGTTHSADRTISIDQGGNDTYTNNAGGAIVDPDAGVTRPLALIFELGGNDTYNQSRNNEYLCRLYPSVGAGVKGGVGMVVDAAGADNYRGRRCSMGMGDGGAGYVLDLGAGSDTYRQTSSSERGYSNIGTGTNGGFGFLVDAGGDVANTDQYTTWGSYNLGFADYQSVGILIGGIGNSTYSNTAPSGATSSGWGMGFGAATGAGAILDPGGSDSFTCGSTADFCMGAAIEYSCGYIDIDPDNPNLCATAANRGPIGLIINRGPSDDSYTMRASGAWGGGMGRAYDLLPLTDGAYDGAALAALVDLGGRDTYSCSARVCFGVGTSGADGIFLDLGGADPNDSYSCASNTYKPLVSTIPLSGSCPGRRNNGLWLGETRPASAGGDTYFGTGVDMFTP